MWKVNPHWADTSAKPKITCSFITAFVKINAIPRSGNLLLFNPHPSSAANQQGHHLAFALKSSTVWSVEPCGTQLCSLLLPPPPGDFPVLTE